MVLRLPQQVRPSEGNVCKRGQPRLASAPKVQFPLRAAKFLPCTYRVRKPIQAHRSNIRIIRIVTMKVQVIMIKKYFYNNHTSQKNKRAKREVTEDLGSVELPVMTRSVTNVSLYFPHSPGPDNCSVHSGSAS